MRSRDKTLKSLTTRELRRLHRKHPELLSEIEPVIRQKVQTMMEQQRVKLLKSPRNIEALKNVGAKIQPAMVFLYFWHHLIRSEEVLETTLLFPSGKSILIGLERFRMEYRAGRYTTELQYNLFVRDQQEDILWEAHDIPKEQLDGLLFNILIRERPVGIAVFGRGLWLEWNSLTEMNQHYMEIQQRREGLAERMTRQFRNLKKEDLRSNPNLRRIVRFILTE